MVNDRGSFLYAIAHISLPTDDAQMIIPAQGSAIAFSFKKVSGCNLTCIENCNGCRCSF
ncbi:MAG: hypothetical protein KME52_01885 [Desmonostoc geniculatum HA4340-LM1]|nr:hypothetical protein [Desmonostoc geniculatum HA4340-LM1]